MSQFSSDELFRLDEIDRLRAANAKLSADYAGKVRAYGEASDEVERLLEVNEQLQAALKDAKTIILAARVLLPRLGSEDWPVNSWAADADKFLAALNEETKLKDADRV